MQHVNTASFRFYEELNDFLPPLRRKTAFAVTFAGNPAVKDTIESLGVPHAEIDLIVVNGVSVGFDYQLRDGDRVAVYPVFETLDISPLTRLRPAPLREPRFVVDVHLGKLARLLRLAGFDTLYRNDYNDMQIVCIARAAHRIILTRDIGLLKIGAVTHGHWIRSTRADAQLREVLDYFDLRGRLRPFHRCLACNGDIRPVPKESVRERVAPKTFGLFEEFFACNSCGRVYWKGSHYDKLARIVTSLAPGAATGGGPPEAPTGP